MLRNYVFTPRSLRSFRLLATLDRFDCVQERQWIATKASNANDKVLAKREERRRSPKDVEDVKGGEVEDEAPKKKRGRPRKTHEGAESKADASNSVDADVQPVDANATPRRRCRALKQGQRALPPRLAALTSEHHHNLPTFLHYAEQKKLNPNSTVYKGTHYEYTCAHTLSSAEYNFELHRIGRANDLGIDLLGWWKLPAWSSTPTAADANTGASEIEDEGKKSLKTRTTIWRVVKVLAQCKALAPKPANIRELEGAYVGAPTGWNPAPESASWNIGDDRPTPTLALLISTGSATQGVIKALRRSSWPMGLLQITREGAVRQFLWNDVAAEQVGLVGLGVTVRYSDVARRKKEDEIEDEPKGKGQGTAGEVKQDVRLTWMGKTWRA